LTSWASKDAEFHIDFKNINFHGEEGTIKNPIIQNNQPFSLKIRKSAKIARLSEITSFQVHF
jgi:hypothetical protein